MVVCDTTLKHLEDKGKMTMDSKAASSEKSVSRRSFIGSATAVLSAGAVVTPTASTI
jgi:hypothetical protein